VPVAGSNLLTTAFANGGASTATHLLSVNGVSAGSLSYALTGGWFSNASGNPNSVRKTVTLAVNLRAGTNTIQLAQGNNYAELDYISVIPYSNATPPIPRLTLTALGGGSGLISWPLPASGYTLQQISDLIQNNWATVSKPVNVVGNQNQATLPIASSNGFFRLYP
jgi:hypothetical protein